MEQAQEIANPMVALQPAWQSFKKACAQAQREIKMSYQYESTSIADFRYLQGHEWYWAAKDHWRQALVSTLGEGMYTIEWVHENPKAPVCLINNVMMFT